MATTIRMKRGGRTHAPYYRVVIMDARDRTRGRVLDEIGVYHPCARPEPRIELNKQKALEWLYKGAVPSDTARSVLSKHGIMAAHAEGRKPEEFAPTPESVEATAPEKTVSEAPAGEAGGSADAG